MYIYIYCLMSIYIWIICGLYFVYMLVHDRSIDGSRSICGSAQDGGLAERAGLLDVTRALRK